MSTTLTPLARENLVRAVRTWRKYDYLPEGNALRWIRSRSNGDRPSLAALHARGLLERRTRRQGRSTADSSYEYRPTQQIIDALARRV